MLSAAVIVVAYQSGDALGRCLDSLAGHDVIVVDNGGGGPEVDAAAERARVVHSSNDGFGAGCNRGARETDADVLVFL
ncbi:MAG TPA: glycosyltransferase, partial [Gaiellaceae bacterium]|nr:glycosyltransferase [Gaiellaceae bacterium]